MKRVYEITLIDHTHIDHMWPSDRRSQTIRYWCICRLKVHEKKMSILQPFDAHILFNSILLVCEELSRIMNNHATSALHMHSSVVSFAFYLPYKCVAWSIKTIIYSENKLSKDCPAEIMSSCTIKAMDDGHSPMRLKLSDKVLLNFFILPIFGAGWAAGIKSHMSLKSESKLHA